MHSEQKGELHDTKAPNQEGVAVTVQEAGWVPRHSSIRLDHYELLSPSCRDVSLDARRPASLPACCTGIGHTGLTKDTGNRIDGKSWTKCSTVPVRRCIISVTYSE